MCSQDQLWLPTPFVNTDELGEVSSPVRRMALPACVEVTSTATIAGPLEKGKLSHLPQIQCPIGPPYWSHWMRPKPRLLTLRRRTSAGCVHLGQRPNGDQLRHANPWERFSERPAS